MTPHQIVIEDFRYGVAKESDRGILRHVLVDFGDVSRAAENRRLVVDVRQDDRDFGGDGRRRLCLRQLPRGDLQDESAVVIVLRLAIELPFREDDAGRRIDVEQLSRSFRHAVRDAIVDPFVAVDGANCQVIVYNGR